MTERLSLVPAPLSRGLSVAVSTAARGRD